ncbi:MAG: septal ring lytic transglycosylase RlpA family protein [Hyphomicrobiaceae bacterium]|nr:septal ring lytic transglycosylase RlpA family protein [Hyphomicrobiaceae bacterium]
MGEKIGSVTNAAASDWQRSKKARSARRHTKATHPASRAARAAHNRRAVRASARVRPNPVVRTRSASRRAWRATRTAAAQTVRSRRLTLATPEKSVSLKPKRTRQAAARTPRRSASAVAAGTTLSGIASYYWQPQKVASGGWFNPSAMTAAHKTLPFGTRVRVTNARNGRSVDVTINDRGPYIAGRIIDLSAGAAGVIGMKSAGIAPVKVEVLGK